MKKSKQSKISVQGVTITVVSDTRGDFINLTDMVRDFDRGSALIEQWLRSKDTIMFLGARDVMYNPTFNSLEFEGIKGEEGRDNLYMRAAL